MRKIKKYPTQAELQKLFYYTPDGILRNKIKRANSIVVGKEAGSLVLIKKQFWYKRIILFGNILMVHRLIWILQNGNIPDNLFIDHIDGNGLNNKIENLRVVTPQENAKNQFLNKKSTSGITGITWVKRDNRWQAGIMVNKKTIHLGYFKNKEDAVQARKEAEKKYGFHSNHGRRLDGV